jgi:hypothetical protein
MPSTTELIHIPLNAGTRQDIDAKLLPQGLMRSLINTRYRKEGSIGPRYGLTAVSSMLDTNGDTVTAWDIASHNESLICFGSTTSGAGGPERVFTWLPDVGRWHAEQHGSRVREFSAVSELSAVYRPTYRKTDEEMLYDLAYAGGHVALVYEDHASNGNVCVHIFDPDTGAVLFEATVAGRTHPRVVGVGSVFVFCWQDASDDVRAATVTVGASPVLSAETVLHNTGTVGSGIDLAPVSGASEFLLLVVRSDTQDATVYRVNTSLSVQASGNLTASDIVLGSIEGNTSTVNVAYVDASGNYELETLTTSTLASATGPTALFGGSTGARPPTLIRKGTDLVIAAAIPDTIDHQLKVDVRAIATHVASQSVTQREVSIQSKLFLSADALFVGAVSPWGEDTLINFTSIVDVINGRGFECAHHRGYAVDALPDWLGSVATDGARYWAVFPVSDLGLDCSHTPVVMQFRVNSPERRQTVSLGGLLYVAGGFVGCWDGQRLVESGFFDAPRILSVTPSNGAGDLTPNAQYSYVAIHEYYDAAGNRHQSAPSDPFIVTMGASDDTNTVVVSSAHTIRRVGGNDQASKILLYRTRAFPDRTHRRCVSSFASSTYAQSVTLVDTASDSEILTQEVVYTQGVRGSLSGPLKHDSFFSCQYLAAKRDRILSGGLPDRSQWQQTKRAFPLEPMNSSNNLGFFGSVRGRVTGVASQDDVDYIFTRNEIFVVAGSGPNDNGSGEFDSPRLLPGDAVGCIRWQSIVATQEGVWFLAHPSRLMLIPRGGGAPQWASQPIRDTLDAFPLVTAAVVVSRDNMVCWCVQNTQGTEGRIIARDSRTGDWMVDELDEFSGAPIQAACEHQGRLAVVSGGAVYLQDNAFPGASFVEYEIALGALAPTGTEGWCRLVSVTATGELRGDCTLDARIAYDDQDGADEVAMGEAPFELVGDSGDTVSVQWWPARRKGARFFLRFPVRALGSSASEGVLLNNITLEIQRSRKASRKPRAQVR